MTQLTRRGLLGAIIAAPAIVRASSLMRIKPIGEDVWRQLTPAEIRLDMAAGYDAIMREIRGNHVALVNELRVA